MHRATVTRYLTDLSGELPIIEEDDGRIWLDRDAYLHNIRLTVHECLAVFLACRLMADRTDRFNPHAAAALRKLGESLGASGPRIAAQIVAEADRLDSPQRLRDPTYLSVLEKLTRGWSEGRLVRLVHHSVNRDADTEYVFGVYLLVPYAVGQSIQTIGQCQGESHLRTLRVDRIVLAELTDQEYSPPPGEELSRLLESAWGIWYSNTEPVEVVLRFSSEVARRVRETVWHPTQTIADQPDGGVRWTAKVAEPKEMYPWIRGWGADVEVLAPPELRERIQEEVGELGRLYGGAGAEGG